MSGVTETLLHSFFAVLRHQPDSVGETEGSQSSPVQPKQRRGPHSTPPLTETGNKAPWQIVCRRIATILGFLKKSPPLVTCCQCPISNGETLQKSFKEIHKITPSNVQFRQRLSSTTTNGTQNTRNTFNKTCYQHSFYPRTTREWNLLPPDLRSISNINAFKNKLDEINVEELVEKAHFKI